jgi:hypothetical protein
MRITSLKSWHVVNVIATVGGELHSVVLIGGAEERAVAVHLDTYWLSYIRFIKSPNN